MTNKRSVASSSKQVTKKGKPLQSNSTSLEHSPSPRLNPSQSTGGGPEQEACHPQHDQIIIGCYNAKGGVGKTTTVLNVGYSFVQEGKRVLLVDADPQCNLTRALTAHLNDPVIEPDFEGEEINDALLAVDNRVWMDEPTKTNLNWSNFVGHQLNPTNLGTLLELAFAGLAGDLVPPNLNGIYKKKMFG
ncbi:hypothetical protein HK100_001940 [Physocladia obscura]|uniref:AAA domain-containing protein n=1 Tax=Physocladia obscura TaxID=109957 RepID=A0AAD5SXQ1_9FUNG|nr:hypothetical protein HK100_001940 [Physocladia obscura]